MSASKYTRETLYACLQSAKADKISKMAAIKRTEDCLAIEKKEAARIDELIADYQRTVDILDTIEKIGGRPSFPDGETGI